jgi:hypothetical protein
MKCPHCLQSFHDSPSSQALGQDNFANWAVIYRKCPECGRYVIELRKQVVQLGRAATTFLPAYPRAISRAPLDPVVTGPYASDYNEACLTLADSPKASAALSRRCLQHILEDKAGVKKGNLANEIQQVIDSGKLPSHLAESLDTVRTTGNFAAHPTKSTASGEVIDVEPGEAEWNLDVLESLFDFYFVQPALLAKKRAALGAKLKDAGKPPLK